METSEQEKTREASPAHAATVEPNQNFFYMLVLIFEVLCMSTLVMLVYWGKVYFNGYAWDGSGLMFNWHPLLMVIGLVILYGNGIKSSFVLQIQKKFTDKYLVFSYLLKDLIYTKQYKMTLHYKRYMTTLFSLFDTVNN